MQAKYFTHGLVIGKFYPPHAGHLYLIKTAQEACQQVTVIVMAADVESLLLESRMGWLKEIFKTQTHVRIVGIVDNIPVDYHSRAIWDAHIALMLYALKLAKKQYPLLPHPPIDAVFTSEHYGDELASYFEAAHVCLDTQRTLYPVSGTAVRQSPAKNWMLLPQVVQAALAIRIVMVGAESTGTTTLSKAVAQAYQQKGCIWSRTTYIPEYGREYTHTKLALQKAQNPLFELDELSWQSSEFLHIAEQQTELEYQAIQSGAPLLICDTDSFATTLWHQRYIEKPYAELDAFVSKKTPPTLYLLTDIHGVAFEQDGLRDGEHIRAKMHADFINKLNQQATPWHLISGAPETRLQQACFYIDEAIQKKWDFADPLG